MKNPNTSFSPIIPRRKEEVKEKGGNRMPKTTKKPPEAQAAGDKRQQFIQIGVTALRDPVTGEYLPSVPLYIRADDEKNASAPPPGAFTDLCGHLADKMRQYVEGCREEGIII